MEWFATRSPELALAPTAAARGTGIQRLRAAGSPLADDFDGAKRRADRLGQLFRGSGHYPLLGGGDINLYSLFVERAMGLVKPDGFVGLLTPSGIYADKTAAKFFKSVSTNGRVSGLFDFENRRPGTGPAVRSFPDVDSRFKFCALVFGGEERRFDETACAFFLHDIRTIADPDRCFPLAPGRLRPREPEHRHGARLPHAAGRGDHPPHLQSATRFWSTAQEGKERTDAWPVRVTCVMLDMANDSRPVQDGIEQLDSDGVLPRPGQPLEEGRRALLAAVPRPKMIQPVRPPGQPRVS